MNIADELTKLNDLKEKGVINQEEFDRQKATLLGAPSKKKHPMSMKWRILIGVLGVLGLAVTAVTNFNKGSTAIPGCDSEQAKSTLGEAFNRSQYAQELKLNVVEITGMAESSFDAQAKKRSCKANVAMNNLSTAQVTYVMQGRDDGQFMLTFEVVGESTEPQPGAATESPAKPTATPTPEQIAADGGNTHADLSGPSFPCEGKLSRVEDLICKTPSLWEADVQLSEWYVAVAPKAPDQAQFKAEQRAWQKQRDACADVACVQAAYSSRIAALQH